MCSGALRESPMRQAARLARLISLAGGEPVLLSWSGSMFEYLMPQLVMPAYENTLLERTCRAAVNRQIAYGRECGVPWGMSESGYNTVDAALNYQYRAFGVPGLGLKRGKAYLPLRAAVSADVLDPRNTWSDKKAYDETARDALLGSYEVSTERLEADLIAFAKQHLASYKCPTSVDWVDALPRNPSGKVLRKVPRRRSATLPRRSSNARVRRTTPSAW